MSEMICITCPMGCHLHIERISENEITVSGNRCPRGEQYAKEEILSPRRVVTATCAIEPESGAGSQPDQGLAPDQALSNLYRPRRVPVRTTKAFPKERIPELLALLYSIKLKLPIEGGCVVLQNALDTGIDVVATRTM
ncbi:MAG: DUF1667 domain-containing protein [Spirochaetaceae bacterium]|nr:DUF1667 domain-containing protein [Spirochaetaceae bacterium]